MNASENAFETFRQRTVRMKSALAGHGPPHGLQTGHGGVEMLATTARTKSAAESRQRCNIPRRNRSRLRKEIRRLIHAVSQNAARSRSGAGWHETATLKVPRNIMPIMLSSRSPELNLVALTVAVVPPIQSKTLAVPSRPSNKTTPSKPVCLTYTDCLG